MDPLAPCHVDMALQNPSHSFMAQILLPHPHGIHLFHHESSIDASFDLELVMKIMDLLGYDVMVGIHVSSYNFLLPNYPSINPSSTPWISWL